tara:strand:+ start:955 stop:3612 length:2658 start_codon:yes stop_codon:yes gene_type:complete
MSSYSQAMADLTTQSRSVSSVKVNNSWEITELNNREAIEDAKKLANTLKSFSPIIDAWQKGQIEAEKERGRELIAERNVNLLKLESLEQETENLRQSYTSLLNATNIDIPRESREEALLSAYGAYNQAAAVEEKFRVESEELLRNELKKASNWTLTSYYREKILNFGATVNDKIIHWMNTNTEPFEYNGMTFTPADITSNPNWSPELHEAAWNIGLDQIMKAAGMDKFSPELLAYHGLTSTPAGENRPARQGIIEAARLKYISGATAEHLAFTRNNAEITAIDDFKSSNFVNNLATDVDLSTDTKGAMAAGETLFQLWNEAAGMPDSEGNLIGSSNTAKWEKVIEILSREGADQPRLVQQFGEIIVPPSMRPPGVTGCADGTFRIKCIWPNKVEQLKEGVHLEELARAERIVEFQGEELTKLEAEFLQNPPTTVEELGSYLTRISSLGVNAQTVDWWRDRAEGFSIDEQASEALIQEYYTDKNGNITITPSQLSQLDPVTQDKYWEAAQAYLQNQHFSKDDDGLGEETYKTVKEEVQGILGVTTTDQIGNMQITYSTDAIFEEIQNEFDRLYKTGQTGLSKQELLMSATQKVLGDVRATVGKPGTGTFDHPLLFSYNEIQLEPLKNVKEALPTIVDIEMSNEKIRVAVNNMDTITPDMFFGPQSGLVIPGSQGYLNEYKIAIDNGQAIPDHVVQYFKGFENFTNLNAFQLMARQSLLWQNREDYEEDSRSNAYRVGIPDPLSLSEVSNITTPIQKLGIFTPFTAGQIKSAVDDVTNKEEPRSTYSEAVDTAKGLALGGSAAKAGVELYKPEPPTEEQISLLYQPNLIHGTPVSRWARTIKHIRRPEDAQTLTASLIDVIRRDDDPTYVSGSVYDLPEYTNPILHV